MKLPPLMTTPLARDLEPILPALDGHFTLAHLKTDPAKCRKLVYQSNVKKKVADTFDLMTSHLLILSYNDLALYGLEVYLYQSKDNWTLFVSKADTTGFYLEDRQKFPLSIKQLTTVLLRGLIKYYIPFHDSHKPLRVCLFGKAHRQYLFPLSSENKSKNILTDRALIKWWIETLDPLADLFDHNQLKASLQIPGSEILSVQSFFTKTLSLPWQVGDIFSDGLPAVKCIPRFPDDPKSRFLDYLVVEHRALKVSKEQFFLELQSRQEFRLGSIVGIIGIEGYVKRHISGDSCEPLSSSQGMLSKRYKALREYLLSLDFSRIDYAKDSTKSFLSRVGLNSKMEIIGKSSSNDSKVKRKEWSKTEINVLPVSMVRKKPKTR